MKTPEEIKQIVTRLAGVAEVLELRAKSLAYLEPEEGEAFQRASKYARDAADLIDELVMANATPKPEVEFPEGSLAAHQPGFRRNCCQLMRTTVHGLMVCWNVAKVERTFPREECKGMFGAPVNFKVCEECAKKEIRFTPNQIPYGVE